MNNTDKQEQEAARAAQFIKEQTERIGAPMYSDLMKLVATGRMIRFKAHIEAGFTEAQALELCKI